MGYVLLRALSFVLIIAAGYGLKKAGLFHKQDYLFVSRLIMTLTLPAAIITGFAEFKLEGGILWVPVIGFLCNAILIFVGWLVSRRQDGLSQAFHMINYSGYNIGCFTMPFMQSFLGASGVVVTALFDAGNAILCTGGTYAFASRFVPGEKKPTLLDSLKKMTSSMPFDVYVLMLVLAVLGLKLPEFVYTITGTFGSANSFLSMFMIGLLFDINLDAKKIKQVAWNLLARFVCAIVFAAGIYYFGPFSLEVKRIMMITVFSPIVSLAPVFTGRLGGDETLAGVINSLSIVIGLICITTLVVTWGIGI